MLAFRLIVFLGVLVKENEAAKILAVFPMPCISHQIVFRPYIQKLVARGHEVVVITADPTFSEEERPTNLTEIDVHDVSYKLWTPYIKTITNKIKTNDQRKFIENYIRVFIKIFEQQAKVPLVKDIIQNKRETFDLILVEACARFALGFSHIINVLIIEISSFGVPFYNYEAMGAPNHPLLYPYPNDIGTPFNELSFYEKLCQYFNFLSIANQYSLVGKLEDDVTREVFGEDTPAIKYLQNNVQMLLLNMHPVWEGIRPVPPGVVHMGGLYQNLQQELPADLKHWLDSSQHGVIYMSFGTNVDTSSLPADKINAIATTFSQMPYDVLWKWDQSELPGQTENTKISKWFPQSALLKHPKLKLFITHGGLQSTDEALSAAVPLIGIPLFVDQWFNTKNYEHHGIGIQINLQTLDTDGLMHAIRMVIEDKRYRENAVRLKALMDDRPMSPLAHAVWCTEYVLKQAPKYAWYLRAPAANMHWTVYFEVKLVIILITIFVVGLLVISAITKLILKRLKLVARRSRNYLSNK